MSVDIGREAYVPGDSPRALFTALPSGREADPASSGFASLPTPNTRLMFEDFYAKVGELDGK